MIYRRKSLLGPLGDVYWWACALAILSLMVLLSACSSSSDKAPPEIIKEDRVIRIAHEYASDHNLDRARSDLEKLDVANAPQWVSMLAQQHANARDLSPEDVRALALLAYDLGTRDEALLAILGTPTAEPSPLPTDTPLPRPSFTPTATPAPDTPTPVAPTAVLETPQAIARGWTNVREGPGKGYRRVGHLIEGEIVRIIGQNPKEDWWQICCWGGGESNKGWVFKNVIDTRGPLDKIPVVKKFPSLPGATARPTTR